MTLTHIAVPDIGDYKDVPLLEMLVAIGDAVSKDQNIALLESDKAVMEVPSTDFGIVAEVHAKAGDKVSAGTLLITLKVGNTPDTVSVPNAKSLPPVASERISERREIMSETTASAMPPAHVTVVHSPQVRNITAEPLTSRDETAAPTSTFDNALRIYAGPATRRLAREFSVDLHAIKGTGNRGRIMPEDVRRSVQSVMSSRHESATPPPQTVDHAQFGPIERFALSRIRVMSGAKLHRNWAAIPHVTNHDDADVTELEAFRTEVNADKERSGSRVSPLPFIMKACVAALQAYPEFNALLEDATLILKRYYHIGFAAETPGGLLVPVIRDVDRKSIFQIAHEMSELSAKARATKLTSGDMQGGSFSISSLGGIGGNYFTPIINAPEVAILGVGKIQARVVWRDGQPQPRLILPVSLSWDHRALDGAAAARFNALLVKLLGDVRRLIL